MERKPYIFMSRGIPAAGKSSWTRLVAQRVFEETGRRITIVCLDDLREVLHQNSRIHYFDRDDENMVQRVQDAVITEAVAIGHDVIVHNTHCSPSPVLRALAAHSEAADIYVVDFPINLEEAKARNKLRSRRVPAHVMDSMQSTLAKRYDQWTDPRLKGIITPAEAEAMLVPHDQDYEDLMADMREED